MYIHQLIELPISLSATRSQTAEHRLRASQPRDTILKLIAIEYHAYLLIQFKVKSDGLLTQYVTLLVLVIMEVFAKLIRFNFLISVFILILVNLRF